MPDSPALRPVHVVVLAAGRGSRLGARTDATPKWLLEVGERTIADRHLAAIALAGDAVASVRVVTGHAAAAIDAEIALRGTDVTAQFNPEFDALNNWWSLLLALRALPDDGPVAVINSDFLADPEEIAAFLTACAAGPDAALIAVDLERELTDVSMKVGRRDGDELAVIGKAGVEDAVGEYVGMLMARGPVLAALRAELEAFVGRDEHVNEWYEAAVGRSAAAGHAWRIWPMPSSAWVEIDDDADLEAAGGLVGAA